MGVFASLVEGLNTVVGVVFAEDDFGTSQGARMQCEFRWNFWHGDFDGSWSEDASTQVLDTPQTRNGRGSVLSDALRNDVGGLTVGQQLPNEKDLCPKSSKPTNSTNHVD